jgi:CheY-like chemotaxis protein
MKPAPRVLVAEDERVSALLLERQLIRAGVVVTVVNDGRDALARVGAETFDLCILDWMLPGLLGIDVVRQSLRYPTSPPMILTSAAQLPTAHEDAAAAGAIAFIPKPLEPKKLVALIHSLVKPARTSTIRAVKVKLGDETVEMSCVLGPPRKQGAR